MILFLQLLYQYYLAQHLQSLIIILAVDKGSNAYKQYTVLKHNSIESINEYRF
jgi:hypothetical protein